MHILLSAYACEPGKGSEPAVGWGWAIGLARRGHRVTVVTRANNRASIEGAAGAMEGLAIEFAYCDLPRKAKWWKKGQRGIHFYYLLWQWWAHRMARDMHRRTPFDRVHHVTFVSIRQPSFMGGLGVPFVFGPVAGGDFVPRNLLAALDWRSRISEVLHVGLSRVAMFDPLVRRTLRQAQAIYVNSEATRRLVPKRYLGKTRVRLAIGWDASDMATAKGRFAAGRAAGPRVLFVGRLVAFKGLQLALVAMAEVCRRWPGAELTVVGSGPLRTRLELLAARLGIAENVAWTGQMPRRALASAYCDHDILLFPSLRDSGGMVVLEALANGVPVVCLQLGGPGNIVDPTCGVVVRTRGLDHRQVATALADATITLADDVEGRDLLRSGAVRRLREFGWDRLIEGLETEPG